MTRVAPFQLPEKVSCPKLPRQRARYRYYAGFSRAFVLDILGEMPKGSRVLDPWNGSGTTTTVATELGLASVGMDLNPAMVVAAKGALLSESDVQLIKDQASRLATLRAAQLPAEAEDPLLEWLDRASVGRVRAIQLTLVGARRYGSDDLAGLDPVKCFWMFALFQVVREATKRWQTSNPTWIKSRQEAPPAKIYWRTLTTTLTELAREAVPIQSTGHPRAEVLCGTSTDIALEDFAPDLVLGSPPYCTRLDYGIATRVELSVLGIPATAQSTLRRALLGTTTVPTSAPALASLGNAALQLLDSVKTHRSKASATYYWKWLAQYLVEYTTSLNQLARVASPTGTIGLVVQESFYKDIPIDLAHLTQEALGFRGWGLQSAYPFRSRPSLAQINPRAEAYRNGHIPQEAALFFRRY